MYLFLYCLKHFICMAFHHCFYFLSSEILVVSFLPWTFGYRLDDFVLLFLFLLLTLSVLHFIKILTIISFHSCPIFFLSLRFKIVLRWVSVTAPAKWLFISLNCSSQFCCEQVLFQSVSVEMFYTVGWDTASWSSKINRRKMGRKTTRKTSAEK